MKGMTFLPSDKSLLLQLLAGVDLNLNAAGKVTSTRCCVKCGRKTKLHRHHITYTPCVTAFLCYLCHSRITGVNAKGSLVAGGNKLTRTDYTNKLRITLWKWFLGYHWPSDKKRITKTEVRAILRNANFKIEPKGKDSRQHLPPRNVLGKPHSPSAFKLMGTRGLCVEALYVE